MSVYFTNNQYLKTAEEDFEAAELLYGHKYYDQIGTLLSVAMTKYLKAIIESIVPDDESTSFLSPRIRLSFCAASKNQA